MLRAIAFAAFACVIVEPPMADAIDGDWCGDKGLHLSIKGPEITTPSGATPRGNFRDTSYVSLSVADLQRFKIFDKCHHAPLDFLFGNLRCFGGRAVLRGFIH